MKYEWLKPEGYLSFESLSTAINKTLSNLGAEYTINFKARLTLRIEQL